jgi:hypothetical protein
MSKTDVLKRFDTIGKKQTDVKKVQTIGLPFSLLIMVTS